jgi:hypothetical protein
VNESISLSFALSRRYRTKASKRQRLWWRCDAANRPPTRAICPPTQRPPKAAVAEHAALAAALADSESASSPRPALTAPIQDAYIMRIQHDPTAALSGLLAQKQSLCRRRVKVLKNIVK